MTVLFNLLINFMNCVSTIIITQEQLTFVGKSITNWHLI